MKHTTYHGITLETAQRHLDEWLEAELELTTHQSYRLGNETLTRADLGEIGKRIAYWNEKVAELKRLQGGRRNRAYPVIPLDR